MLTVPHIHLKSHIYSSFLFSINYPLVELQEKSSSAPNPFGALIEVLGTTAELQGQCLAAFYEQEEAHLHIFMLYRKLCGGNLEAADPELCVNMVEKSVYNIHVREILGCEKLALSYIICPGVNFLITTCNQKTYFVVHINLVSHVLDHKHQ